LGWKKEHPMHRQSWIDWGSDWVCTSYNYGCKKPPIALSLFDVK